MFDMLRPRMFATNIENKTSVTGKHFYEMTIEDNNLIVRGGLVFVNRPNKVMRQRGEVLTTRHFRLSVTLCKMIYRMKKQNVYKMKMPVILET